MPSTPESTAQPRMLALTQIQAHVSRLNAVREGLRKFADNDGRAAEGIRILEVAIKTLNSEPFPTNAAEEPFVDEVETEETIEQVQQRERAPGGAAYSAPVDETASEADPSEGDESNSERKPSTGFGSDRGIV